MMRFRFGGRLICRAAVLLAMVGGERAAAQVLPPCGTDALCFGGGRFQVTAFWTDPSSADQHAAIPVSLTGDSGYFWFFDPANIELTVKVLDACSVNGHEWIFAAGMTNLAVEIQVTDQLTGAVVTYSNPAGTAFEPVQDTKTFSNCGGSGGGPLSGTWTGVFNSADAVDCDLNTPAEAVFEQEGSNVTGALTSPGNFCGPDHAEFSGTLVGDTLSGTVTGAAVGGGLYTNARASGTLSSSSLVLQIANGVGLIPGGTLELHR